MGIESIKRWQWIVMSLLIGLLVGYVWNSLDDIGATTGDQIKDQRTFERALVNEVKKADGTMRREFDEVAVTPYKNSNDPSVAYVVTGKMWVNMPKMINGKKVFGWWPQYYLAPAKFDAPPVKTTGPVPGPSLLQRTAELLRLRAPDEPKGKTVVDYLRALSASPAHVQFTYKWWNEPRVRIAAWTAGCFLGIGVIWPFFLNIMLFGSLWRPIEEKGVSLRKAKSTSSTVAKPRNAITEKDMAELAALEAELEAKLAADAKPRSASDEPQEATPAPIKVLGGGGSDTVKVPEQTAEQKAFAARQDDFYPTERGSKKKPGGKT
jgi:hypothetical protein